MVKKHTPLGAVEKQVLDLAFQIIYPIDGESIVYVKNKQVLDEVSLRLTDKNIQLFSPNEKKPVNAILWLESITPDNIADFDRCRENLKSGGKIVVLAINDFSKWQISSDNEFGNTSMVVDSTHALILRLSQTKQFVTKIKGIFGIASFLSGICAGLFQHIGIDHLVDQFYFYMREKMIVSGKFIKFARYNLIIAQEK